MNNSSWSFSKVALSVTKLTDLNKFLNALTYAQFVSCQNKNSKSKINKDYWSTSPSVKVGNNDNVKTGVAADIRCVCWPMLTNIV